MEKTAEIEVGEMVIVRGHDEKRKVVATAKDYVLILAGTRYRAFERREVKRA